MKLFTTSSWLFKHTSCELVRCQISQPKYVTVIFYCQRLCMEHCCTVTNKVRKRMAKRGNFFHNQWFWIHFNHHIGFTELSVDNSSKQELNGTLWITAGEIIIDLTVSCDASKSEKNVLISGTVGYFVWYVGTFLMSC